jgi:hypothetical protein
MSTIASAIAWNSSFRKLEGHQDDPAMLCIRYDTFVSESMKSARKMTDVRRRTRVPE